MEAGAGRVAWSDLKQAAWRQVRVESLGQTLSRLRGGRCGSSRLEAGAGRVAWSDLKQAAWRLPALWLEQAL